MAYQTSAPTFIFKIKIINIYLLSWLRSQWVNSNTSVLTLLSYFKIGMRESPLILLFFIFPFKYIDK